MNTSILRIRNINSRDFNITAFMKDLVQRLKRWYFNYRTRRQLAELDHYQLQDIGISRSDAMNEVGKPFWK